MPSPFPGMDPFLEGSLWPDVHQRLAADISRQLAPRLRPRYVPRLSVYVFEDKNPEAEIGIMYPDVKVLTTGRGSDPGEQTASHRVEAAPVVIPMIRSIEVRLVNVEIRDSSGNQLVTSIEVLSPVNKREPGLRQYRDKREHLYQSGVHLLEIDLLRRGTRPLALHPRLPEATYLVTLTRAGSHAIEIWPIALSDALPSVPVPLRAPDADVPLDLGSSVHAIYEEAAYDLSLDYRQPPPPPALTDAELTWARSSSPRKPDG